MFGGLQRRLIYRPVRTRRVCPVAAGLDAARVEPVSYVTDDGLTLQGWHVPAIGKRRSGVGTLLFFPGNGFHREKRGTTCRVLSEMGLDVFLFDYRGYAENPGRPTEDLISTDARAIWRSLTEQRKIPAGEIVIYGESLGGGVSTRLAAELCVKGALPGGLILCATFSSLLDAAIHNYGWLPVRRVLIERYPSIELIHQVTCPLLVMHGEQDRVVPFALGRQLFEAARSSAENGIGKGFVSLPKAGHNDILKVEEAGYRAGIEGFLDTLSRAGV